MVILSMSLNSPQDSPLKHAHRSATKIWARLSMRTGFLRPSNLCSSRKQTKSLARVLTSLAAEFLPEAIRFVMLHEYFCGTSDSCVGLRSRRLRAYQGARKGARSAYLIQDLTGLPQTCQSGFQKGDLLVCTRPEDVPQRVERALLLVLPVVRVENRDTWSLG